MKVRQNFTVLGARWFKGNVEGTDHDFTKLAVVMPMSDLRGTAVGNNALEMACGPSEVGPQFQGLDYPCEIELEVLVTTKGPEIKAYRIPQRPASAVNSKAAV